MQYELWDVETNHYLGRYDDESEALRLVRSLVESYGVEFADKLDFGIDTGDGETFEILSGQALIERVEKVLDDTRPSEDRRGVVIASS